MITKEFLDTKDFPCNMIVTDGRNVCVVKDTCEGCKFDSDYCAIHDMLEACHLFESWEKMDLPTFRERLKREAEDVRKPD